MSNQLINQTKNISPFVGLTSKILADVYEPFVMNGIEAVPNYTFDELYDLYRSDKFVTKSKAQFQTLAKLYFDYKAGKVNVDNLNLYI